MMPEFFFIDALGSLYRDVQLQKVFPDSKYFVDCIPTADPALIAATYEKEKNQPGFDLNNFVSAHFILPPVGSNTYQSNNKPILQHLTELWDELTRQPQAGNGGTLIPLPLPYIVPGGRFREIYYWDSYFTMLGLQVSKRIDIIQNMVDNFAWLIDTIGFIPNGNRTYYLSRSQPPFFTLMVELLASEKGEGILLQYLPQLEREYAFWMDEGPDPSTTVMAHRHTVRMPDGTILNRYWDSASTARPEAYLEDSHAAASAVHPEEMYRHIRAACASGWDFSSRWFRDGNNMATIQAADIVPIDLNCLLLHTEEVLLHIYTTSHRQDLAALFTDKIARRKSALHQYCWSREHGFYFDYQFVDQAITGQFTLGATYALFFGLADPAQAAQVATVIKEKFLQMGGLLTTLNPCGQQWDAPNGWAPLQWMTYKGLLNYGHQRLATDIKNRWMAATETVYAATGKMMEKYDVTAAATNAGGGEYPNQDGFGWTNGVYLKFTLEP